MDNQERIRELFSDAEFMKEFLSKCSAEEAQTFLGENGVEMPLQEVEAIGEVFSKIASGEITDDQLEKISNGELSEAELEQAAGGIFMSGTVVAVIIAGSVISGGTIAAVVCSLFNW